MRVLVWLFRAFLFFCLLAFSLANQQTVSVNWFFGYASTAPMVIILLVTFAVGAAFGVMAMTPPWWRQWRQARKTRAPAPAPVAEPQKPAIPDAPTAPIDGI